MVPISAQLRYNIDVVAEYITNHIPVPVRNFTGEPKMIVIRSFDVNKPGEEVHDLRGGVAGGVPRRAAGEDLAEHRCENAR